MRISDWSSDVCSSDLVAEHPNTLDEARREALGLRRLPETLEAAIAAWQADEAALGWFAPDFAESWLGVRRAEMARPAGLAPDAICALYPDLYRPASSGMPKRQLAAERHAFGHLMQRP